MCIPQTSTGKLSDFTLPEPLFIKNHLPKGGGGHTVAISKSCRIFGVVLSCLCQGPLPELLLDAMVEQLWVGGPKSKDLDQIPMDSVKLGER